MKIEFRSEELISKGGRTYPVVGGRLRLAHEDNDLLSIDTTMVEFEALSHAVIKATLITEKGNFSAYGVATVSKDERLKESLLELAETRSIARALRFAGYGVEYTGIEEMGNEGKVVVQSGEFSKRNSAEGPSTEDEIDRVTKPQIHAIEKIAAVKRWDAVECCRRILGEPQIQDVQDLSKNQAIEVIGRMKSVA